MVPVEFSATVRLLTGEEPHPADGPPTKLGELLHELCEPCKRKTAAKALHASD